MIECTEQYIYKKCKKNKKKKIKIIVFLLFMIVIFVYYRYIVSINVSQIVKDIAFSESTNCINNTILYKVDNTFNYKDLTIIEKNNDNEISFISFNTDKINILTRNIVYFVNQDLNKCFESGFNIPIMAFSGISFFSGYGFNVSFNSLSLVSVQVDYENYFVSQGINQTLHSIYAIIKSQVVIQLPLANKSFEIVNKVLLTQSLIVGKVPEVYLNKSI